MWQRGFKMSILDEIERELELIKLGEAIANANNTKTHKSNNSFLNSYLYELLLYLLLTLFIAGLIAYWIFRGQI